MDLEWNQSKRPLLLTQHIGEFLGFLVISFMNWILTPKFFFMEKYFIKKEND